MDLTRGLPLQPARMFQDQLYAGLAQVPSARQAAPDDFNKMFPKPPRASLGSANLGGRAG
jgi:hypothetical protein